MKLWIRKFAVILIAIMTLGLYVPPTLITTDTDENNESVSSKNDHSEIALTPIDDNAGSESEIPSSIDAEEDSLHLITEKAKEQMISKLGPKISSQIEDDFMMNILPHMEEALTGILTDVEEDELSYYAITEQPAKGYGEQIFNIYDYRTNKDVARFHVRRDNRPLEGYWFNFHYHLENDGFEEHHEIGEIYWDKNIPPKWMS